MNGLILFFLQLQTLHQHEEMLKILSSKAVSDETRGLFFKFKGKNATKRRVYRNSDFTLFPTALQKNFSSG